MEAIYDAWYSACDQWGEQQARRKFARVFHEPAPVDAKPKKPILKKASIGVVVGVDHAGRGIGHDGTLLSGREHVYYI